MAWRVNEGAFFVPPSLLDVLVRISCSASCPSLWDKNKARERAACEKRSVKKFDDFVDRAIPLSIAQANIQAKVTFRDNTIFSGRSSEMAAKVGGDQPLSFLPHEEIIRYFHQFFQVCILDIIDKE
jgi:hypothetical protein